MTLFNLEIEDKWEWTAGAFIISAIFGIYMFYLINTGISNVANTLYNVNIVALIGLLMHFVFLLAIPLYAYFNLELTIVITTIVPIGIGIAVGVFDLKKFLASWKERKKISQIFKLIHYQNFR